MYLVREMDQLYTKAPISVAQQLEAMIADRGNKMLRYWKEVEKEKSAFEPLYINIPNETLKYRIKNMGEWYIEYACKNKFRFYFFNFIAIIAPLVVTLFNALSLEYGDIVKVVTVSCSLLTSFSASYVALTRCLEKWKIYRDSIESIKRLLVLYWVDQIDDQNLKTLVNDLEALKGKEYERWSSTYNAIAKTSVSRGKSEENSAGKDSGTSSK